MAKQIVLDFETQSECELKKTGAVKYAQDPTTRVLCMAYKIDNENTQIWVPGESKFPTDIMWAPMNDETVFVAHNALFEQSIWRFCLPKQGGFQSIIAPNRWKCTAAKAAACALPRNLEGAAIALGLPVKKNMDGRRLMLKYMKPRPAWTKKKTGDKYFNDQLELWAIHDYCKTDVEVEYLLDKALPDLIPFEQELWCLNQRMNLHGIQVDIETVKLIQRLIFEYSAKLIKRVHELSNGKLYSVAQRDRVIDWLKERGVEIESLNAKTVEFVLNELRSKGGPKKAIEMLEIRQLLSKTSTKKYQAMVLRAGSDNRVRDLSMYHGASTGRESGTGIQIQNLPKGSIKNTDLAIEEIIESKSLETIELLYGSPMNVFSSCIRGMITASSGCELFVADYNAIEARVLSWIAGFESDLETYRQNKDGYLKLAAEIYHVDLEELIHDYRNGDKDAIAKRFVGKTAKLGLGYQMGAKKFFDQMALFGNPISMEFADEVVAIYRSTHEPIAKLWPRIERAAIYAVEHPKKIVTVDHVKWFMKDKFLVCQLPSDRKLRYYDPEVRNEATPWGEMRPKLYHWSVNPKTKKWECAATYGGKLVENVVQAVARDITMSAVYHADKAGYCFLFQVHDEIVSEKEIDKGSIEDFTKILTTLPAWAKGLPIVAEGWKGHRYKK